MVEVGFFCLSTPNGTEKIEQVLDERHLHISRHEMPAVSGGGFDEWQREVEGVEIEDT